MKSSDYNPRGIAPEHLGRLLLRAWRGVTEDGMVLVRRLGHPDLKAGHLPLFANIDAGGTRINELADRADVTRQMMGRLVKELEELGYVETAVDPADARAVIVTLTERGGRFRRDADKAMAQLTRRYEKDLGAAAVADLHETLRRLIGVAGKIADASEKK